MNNYLPRLIIQIKTIRGKNLRIKLRRKKHGKMGLRKRSGIQRSAKWKSQDVFDEKIQY